MIHDVELPSPEWVNERAQKVPIAAIVHGPQRLYFEHLLGTNFPDTFASPAFPGRQSMPLPSARILRPLIPRSVVFSESEVHLPAVAVDPTSADECVFEEEVHANVLRIHLLEYVRLELRPLVGVGPFVSERGIEEITACANNIGHDVALVGSPSGLGRFAWKLNLQLYGKTSSLKNMCFHFLEWFAVSRFTRIWLLRRDNGLLAASSWERRT